MTRIANNSSRTKHDVEITYFNRLIIDLKKFTSENPFFAKDNLDLTMDRLNEATRHLAKLAECRERIKLR